ncbi:phosphoenolpyruvate carboxykinase, cytosolic [GTP]-like [Sycon ciliatum]|uniref:phosphoenolpyruvate carboxykinase, cytosolic [GTP]-like n=1 Tax=Sycon ciliatum TaxID=27933 RepID=UPI0031F69107
MWTSKDKSISVEGKGDFSLLNAAVSDFLEQYVRTCSPSRLHLCDGSDEENKKLCELMRESGMVRPLTSKEYTNCWSVRTDPTDVARLESKTLICTPKEEQVVAEGARHPGTPNMLGKWMSEEQMDAQMKDRLPRCMKGRVMYIIPFSMGPVGSPLAKIGIQLTDSPYVVASMRVMTRIGTPVIKTLNTGAEPTEFVRCMHTVGRPDPADPAEVQKAKMRLPTWPCDPERVLIAHYPMRREIVSYGSGYGGNSLLGKKCFALRIASWIGKEEGWLAEHMLIMRVQNPEGDVRYVAAAFPSACGKTNLAMMEPSLPGWDVKCVGDDIAWLKFDNEGRLRAINPENGFFGVAPGTSLKTNPNAMEMVHRNTIFTNVAYTERGDVYWEGMDPTYDLNNTKVISWRGIPHWKPGMCTMDGEVITAAHPNSRFCTPLSECPVVDPLYNSAEGVPIDAIIFGGRRPDTIPLVFESFNWPHGVFLGSAMRSETTKAAADVTEKLRHDPFAMRPFFGYNFGEYLQHWLNLEKPGRKMPSIFHVNWFLRGEQNEFLWPGFGENARILEWIFKRLNGDSSVARASPIGMLPTNSGIRSNDLSPSVDMDRLLNVDHKLWLKEEEAIRSFLEGQLGKDCPAGIVEQIHSLRERLANTCSEE